MTEIYIQYNNGEEVTYYGVSTRKMYKITEKQLKIGYILNMERFHSRGQHLCKFIGTKESVCIRKEFNSHRIVLVHNMAAVSLFWNTNIAAVTSSENAL